MSFASDVQKIGTNLDSILAVTDVLTSDRLASIDAIRAIDFDEIQKIHLAARDIKEARRDILVAENGLHNIREVLSIQNQVKYVSDIRDQIGLVAGYRGEDITKIANSLSVLELIPSMADDILLVLELRPKIEAVLKISEDIEEIVELNNSIQEGIRISEDLQLRTRQSEDNAKKILDEIKLREKIIDEKLQRMESLQTNLSELKVNVRHTASDSNGSSHYSGPDNVLNIEIPRGRQGQKGDSVRGERGPQGKIGIPGIATKEGKEGKPGKDGRDFAVTAFGSKREMVKYSNRVAGTSFLSLDEIPTMIYFKKSDKVGDWTEGQPFGISNGENANIVVEDAQKLGGYTLQEIYTHIEQAFKRIKGAKDA